MTMKSKFDPFLTRKWIAALRSGDYIQGKSMLKYSRFSEDQIRYCCLGVLGEICDPDKFSIFQSNDAYDFEGKIVYYWDEQSFSSLGAEILDDDIQNLLIFLNDSRGYSFNDIADVLEVMLP